LEIGVISVKTHLSVETTDLPDPPYPDDTRLPPLTREQFLDMAVNGMGAPRHEAAALIDEMIAKGQFVPGDS
jgi:hypothetical protein